VFHTSCKFKGWQALPIKYCRLQKHGLKKPAAMEKPFCPVLTMRASKTSDAHSFPISKIYISILNILSLHLVFGLFCLFFLP
jgi:hypothetical protein